MRARQSLPKLWLISDERNDSVLEAALESQTARIAFVFRHNFLPPEERFARFNRLLGICKRREHLMILADSAQTAKEWGAGGIYGAPLSLYPERRGLLFIATAHNLREIAQANRKRADAVMLSPVFPTRSHPGARTLGPTRFRLMARYAQVPVIALGGMNRAHATGIAWPRWAAIDGLV